MSRKTQRRGTKRVKAKRNRTLRQRRRTQSGGMGVLDTAIVPFGILALQRYMQKKVKVPKSLSRRRRRKGKKN